MWICSFAQVVSKGLVTFCSGKQATQSLYFALLFGLILQAQSASRFVLSLSRRTDALVDFKEFYGILEFRHCGNFVIASEAQQSRSKFS